MFTRNFEILREKTFCWNLVIGVYINEQNLINFLIRTTVRVVLWVSVEIIEKPFFDLSKSREKRKYFFYAENLIIKISRNPEYLSTSLFSKKTNYILKKDFSKVNA